ncbi:MAG: hypothetical protein ACE5Z5_00790 [Candidatus Bathyarchaeia archaeon]
MEARPGPTYSYKKYDIHRGRRVRALSTTVLLVEHGILHNWAASNYKNRPPDWTIEEIKDRHDRIAREMVVRGLLLAPHADLGEDVEGIEMYMY